MGIFLIQSNSFNSARYYKQRVDKSVGICVFTSLFSNYDRPRGIVFFDTMSMKKISFDVWIQLLGMFSIVASLVFVGLEMRQSQRIAIAGQQQARSALANDIISQYSEMGIDFQSVYWETNTNYELSIEEIG